MTEEVQAIDDGLRSEEYDLESIISENKHLKKTVGDQGNEIGTLRRGMDQILLNQQSQTEDVDDWDADPVQKDVTALRAELGDIKQEQQLRSFESKHPGYLDKVKTEEFQGWVEGSQYRSNLYKKADGMDMLAADELLTAFEEAQEAGQVQQSQKRTNRKKALNEAQMETGSAGGMRKTYFSRTALIDMRINNPTKYESMRDEIHQAYAEGRVKK